MIEDDSLRITGRNQEIVTPWGKEQRKGKLGGSKKLKMSLGKVTTCRRNRCRTKETTGSVSAWLFDVSEDVDFKDLERENLLLVKKWSEGGRTALNIATEIFGELMDYEAEPTTVQDLANYAHWDLNTGAATSRQLARKSTTSSWKPDVKKYGKSNPHCVRELLADDGKNLMPRGVANTFVKAYNGNNAFVGYAPSKSDQMPPLMAAIDAGTVPLQNSLDEEDLLSEEEDEFDFGENPAPIVGIVLGALAFLGFAAFALAGVVKK